MREETSVLLASAIVFASLFARADRPLAAQEWTCPDSGHYTHVPVLPTRKGESLAPAIADSALYERDGVEELYWRGDLNGDSRDDFITDYGFGSTATNFAVFVSCGGGRYLRVLQGFASGIHPLDATVGAWRVLRADYDIIGTESVALEFYHWDGAVYTVVCAAEVSIDSVATHAGCPP